MKYHEILWMVAKCCEILHHQFGMMINPKKIIGVFTTYQPIRVPWKYHSNPNWLVVSTPLKNMSSSLGMMKFPIYGKSYKPCSSHHQPDIFPKVQNVFHNFHRNQNWNIMKYLWTNPLNNQFHFPRAPQHGEGDPIHEASTVAGLGPPVDRAIAWTVGEHFSGWKNYGLW